GLAYLFISHDLAAVRYISNRIMVMYLGRIVESANSADLYARPLHPYTVALLSAAPVPNPKVERSRERIILAGDMPKPSATQRGCRFRGRCWLSRRLGAPEECQSQDPGLVPLSRDRSVACHFADRVDGRVEHSVATDVAE